jgi:hypothetical protein
MLRAGFFQYRDCGIKKPVEKLSLKKHRPPFHITLTFDQAVRWLRKPKRAPTQY